MSTPAIPPHVLANMTARARGERPAQLLCPGTGCDRPGIHGCARYGGLWCTDCFNRLPRQVPTPDPTRTADALYAKRLATLNGDQT